MDKVVWMEISTLKTVKQCWRVTSPWGCCDLNWVVQEGYSNMMTFLLRFVARKGPAI